MKQNSFLHSQAARMTIVVLLALMLSDAILYWRIPDADIHRIILGTFLVIFLPGYLLSYVFFPGTHSIIPPSEAFSSEEPALDWLERLTLSFALSLSVVPFVIYLSNRLGMPITQPSVITLVIAINIVSVVALLMRQFQMRHPSH